MYTYTDTNRNIKIQKKTWIERNEERDADTNILEKERKSQKCTLIDSVIAHYLLYQSKDILGRL